MHNVIVFYAPNIKWRYNITQYNCLYYRDSMEGKARLDALSIYRYIFSMRQPLYQSVAEQLRSRIEAGDYAPGSALPPEPELEREFNVSRITVRQALAVLKRRGLLLSRSGRGTLVHTRSEAPCLRTSGSLRDLSYYAERTLYHSLSNELVAPPGNVRSALRIDDGDRTYCFRGTRSGSDGKPFSYEEIYVPEEHGRRVPAERIPEGTVFSLLEEVTRLRIIEAEQRITAVSAPARVTRHLGGARRRPLLRVTRTYKAEQYGPIEFAVVFYDTASFEYTMMLYPD